MEGLRGGVRGVRRCPLQPLLPPLPLPVLLLPFRVSRPPPRAVHGHILSYPILNKQREKEILIRNTAQYGQFVFLQEDEEEKMFTLEVRFPDKSR